MFDSNDWNLDERIRDDRIELRRRPAENLVERRFEGSLAAVRAIGGHRVEGVRHGHDARDERDVLAREPVGIPLAIVALVMVPDRLRFAREEPERLGALCAQPRMGSRRLERLLPELPRLASESL